MLARIVIGSNFGDCGKGAIVDHLCSTQGAGIVVRFNGGAQSGHTVCTIDKERHVFRHFGSGTLLEVPTFLSQFFVCNPILFFEELKQLRDLGFHPEVYAHPDCLITTYADMLINQVKERRRGDGRHGSCGIGFHETIQRSSVNELKITMSDLWNWSIGLKSRIEEICTKYAKFRIGESLEHDKAIEVFIECCRDFANYVQPLGIAQCKDPVFEGGQGLLLDQDNKEFFPHVTHSHTGMHNVEILCKQAGITKKDIYYVSRTYLTRHGYGPLPGEDDNMNFHDDTNRENEFQGKLRFAPLNTDLLHARIKRDAGSNPYKLVLTHCDQLEPSCDADLYSVGPTRTNVTESKPIQKELIDV